MDFKRRSLSSQLMMGFKLVTLLCIAAIAIATSKASDVPNHPYTQIASQVYLVSSNCPQSFSQEQIEVVAGSIVKPNQRDFRQFGLPSEVLNVGLDQQSTGLVNGIARTCQYSHISNQGTELDMYSCFEASLWVCGITFEKVL